MVAEVFKTRKQLLVRAIRFKTRYYFRLLGNNGEIIAQSEAYTAKHNAVKILSQYFPSWEVHDLTNED